jgi:hypothetical protein
VEALECSNDQVLSFAVLELPAGKHRKSLAEFSRFIGGVEQHRVNTLRAIEYVRQASGLQNFCVPA